MVCLGKWIQHRRRNKKKKTMKCRFELVAHGINYSLLLVAATATLWYITLHTQTQQEGKAKAVEKNSQ